MTERLDRRDLAWLAIVVGAAFAVRLAYLLQLRHSPYFAAEVVDAAVHDVWAQRIAAGLPWADGPYFRAPLYPWFLGALYRLTDSDTFVVRLAQGLLGSVSCGLVYVLGRRAFDRRTGGIAGVVCAFYWLLPFFDHELLVPVLAIPLYVLLVWALLRVVDGGGLAFCALSGVFLGLAALALPNVLLFAPFVALWLALWRPLPRPGLRAAALFAAGSLIVVLPVTARNLIVGHDLVLVSSHAGLNLWIGNNPDADGLHVLVPGLDLTIDDVYETSARVAEAEAGRDLAPSEVSRHYTSKAVDWIMAEPGDFLALTARKLVAFWSAHEVVNNKHFGVLTRRYTPIATWLPFGFWSIGPLGLAGIVACRRRPWATFPMWGFVLVYMVSVVLFFVTARFRLPVVPVLAVLAAHGLLEGLRHARAREWGALAPLAGAAVVGALLASWTPGGATRTEALALHSLAAALALQDRHAEALALADEAAALDPRLPGPLITRALLLHDRGRDDEAAAAFEDALAAAPDDTQLLERAADAALAAGLDARAADWLERLLALDPTRRDTAVELTLLRAGSTDATVRSCEAAVRAADVALSGAGRRDPRAWDATGAARAECGDLPGALEAASTALRLARERGGAHALAEIDERYRTYLAGRPWRRPVGVAAAPE